MQQYQDLLIDALLDQGFSLEEAEQLVTLHTRVEQTQRQQERAQWLANNTKPDQQKNP